MFRQNIMIALIPVMIMAGLVPVDSAFAGLSCREVNRDNPNYHENMDVLAERAKLPDNYWNRYHEDVVRALCSGNAKDIDGLVDAGFMKPGEAQNIAKALGKTYQPKNRSEAGKSYGYSRKKFVEMGACSACADNIAQHYTKKPNSPCGKLAKQALEGNPEAIKKLVAFPDYCRWKY